MATTCAYNVFVGAETGLLKGIRTNERRWQNLNAIDNVSRSREITTMCWGQSDKSQLCVGLRDNCVLTFEALPFQAFGIHHDRVREDGPFFGAQGHINSMAKFNDRFITGFSAGLVAVWSGDANDNDSLKITTGDNLWAMAQRTSEPNIIATGGKENPLKLWDLNNITSPVFVSKNVRNDWLNLRVPIWVTKIQFHSDGRRVVTGTGNNQVRVYDTKARQRRPVINFNFQTYPVTALSVCSHQDNQLIVGNTFGDMGLLDLRKSQTVQLYKGFTGGITDLHCHSSEAVVVSCSVDRFVRVHDINSKDLLDKFYLKSRLNCLLLTDEWPQNEKGGKSQSDQGLKQQHLDNGEAGADEDAVWDSLDVVQTKTVIKGLKQEPKRKSEIGEKEISTHKHKIKKNKKIKLT